MTVGSGRRPEAGKEDRPPTSRSNSRRIRERPRPKTPPHGCPPFQDGGIDTFSEWVMANIRHPRQASSLELSRYVTATFVVDKTGRIRNTDIIESPLVRRGSRLCTGKRSAMNSGNLERKARPRPIRRVHPAAPFPRPPVRKVTFPPQTPFGSTHENLAFRMRLRPHPPRALPAHAQTPDDPESHKNRGCVQLAYPEKATDNRISGRVAVEYAVSPEGEVSGVRVVDSPHKILSNEVLRIMRRSPRWTPRNDRTPARFPFPTFSGSDNPVGRIPGQKERWPPPGRRNSVQRYRQGCPSRNCTPNRETKSPGAAHAAPGLFVSRPDGRRFSGYDPKLS